MLTRALRAFVVLGLVISPAAATAQVIPSPAQAQQMLQDNPALIGRLQQMLQSSGMTADQIRARLRAQGYPEALLDQYLPGGHGDSTLAPGDDVFAAVRALGIADSLSLDSLRFSARSTRRMKAQADSAFLDTLQRALANDTTAEAIRTLLHSRELQDRQLDSGFKVFGLDLFQNETSQFDAATVVGADPSYRFGPGDRLVLFLTGDVEKSYDLMVNGQGFVVIPDVGAISVAGQTRAQLEDVLYTRLGRVYSGVRRGAGATTRFYVDVAQMGANQVYVHGDVMRPGAYRISRAGTVMTALYQSGGPTANGTMRGVRVMRGGHLAATLDVYDYALHGDAGNDLRLENGDIVFVPPRGPQVRVAGAVLRPATYETKATQTVADVIRAAGGFAERADQRRVQIRRIVPPTERTTAGRDRVIIDVPPELIESAPVRGGDVILVPVIAGRVTSRVTVAGDVWSPGSIGFAPGMSLYDALRRVGGLKPDAFLGDVLVNRLHADSTREMLRTAVFDTTGKPRNDISLADGDAITVFSTTDMRPKRYITIGGAVRTPGIQIPYSDGMTLRDAVLLAGGLQEGALLTDAEIARLPENRAAGATAVPTSVNLDSTYLFDRGPDGRVIVPPGIVVPAARAPQVLLQPYDAVMIKWQPDWQLQQTVMLRGEVRYPGDYALVTKTERLSDVLARAGGLMPAAYAGGVVFVRRRGNVGRVGIDLPAVLRDPRSNDNLQLMDGDSIYIPRFNPVVVVKGAVNSQVGVSYVNGADIDFYVRSAGGTTAQGDGRHTFVTQPNGKVETKTRRLLLFSSNPRPAPGSTVYVPLKDPNARHDWGQIATTSTSILGSLVAIAAIVRR